MEIFSRCYEIDAIVNSHEILIKNKEGLPDSVLEALLQRRDIMAELYDLCLKKNDRYYREMKLKILQKNSKGDDIYGRKHR